MKIRSKPEPALQALYSRAQQEFYDSLILPRNERKKEERDPPAAGSGKPPSSRILGESTEESVMRESKRKQGIARLMELAGKRRIQLLAACLFAIIGAGGRLTPFITVYFMMNEVVFHWGDPSGIDVEYLGWLTLWTFVAAAVYGSGMYLSTMLAHTAAFNILYDVRVQLMSKLARIPSGFFSQVRQGELKRVMNSDVEMIESFVAHHLSDTVSAISLPLLTIAFLFVIDWRFAIALIIPLVLAGFLLGQALKTEEGSACQKAMQHSIEVVEGTTVEFVHGMSVVKVFNRSLSAFKRFEADSREYVGNIKWATYFNASGMGKMYAAIGSQVFWLVLGVLIVLPTVESYPSFVSVVLLFFLVGSGMKEPVLQMITQSLNINKITASVARIDEILAYPEVEESLSPLIPSHTGITFEDVSFSYHENAQALNKVNFVLSPGSITGLVGPSGGGKSTIASMIVRFFDVGEGRVSIGGIDIRDIDPDQLTHLVSFVFQDSFIFVDTVANNIRMGDTRATDQEVIAAAKAAHIDDVISALPSGYNTVIGPGGSYLSGGEAQRLAIARVFLRNTPIVLLDEATAYADAENETRIQESFARLAQDKTVIIIAHRLKTVEGADCILVMDEGALVGKGTHDELLATNKVYQDMVAAHERRDGWEMVVREGDETHG